MSNCDNDTFFGVKIRQKYKPDRHQPCDIKLCCHKFGNKILQLLFCVNVLLNVAYLRPLLFKLLWRHSQVVILAEKSVQLNGHLRNFVLNRFLEILLHALAVKFREKVDAHDVCQA